MNVELLAILSLIAYVFVSGTWSKMWRARLLKKESANWTASCRVTSGKSCEIFVGCCKRFPEIARCAETGGILEYPTCSYWSEDGFDSEKHGDCGCFEKFIVADYKSNCQSEGEKEDCMVFVGCCVGADKGRCGHFVSGELEVPACHYLMGKPFNYSYNDAVCQCAIDSPNATLKENKTSPTFPDITMPTIPTEPNGSTSPASTTPTFPASTTPTFPETSTPPPTPTTPPPPAVKLDSDSGGEKSSGSCVWMVTLAMLTAVIFHRYQQPMV